jgi:hypothetical protein
MEAPASSETLDGADLYPLDSNQHQPSNQTEQVSYFYLMTKNNKCLFETFTWFI